VRQFRIKLSHTHVLYIFPIQSNEIDLDALLLMSEKDFSEIGLPKVPHIFCHYIKFMVLLCAELLVCIFFFCKGICD